MSDAYRVWAIQYEGVDRETRTVAVAAESEYGAVNRYESGGHLLPTPGDDRA